jgi:hypothetical protein
MVLIPSLEFDVRILRVKREILPCRIITNPESYQKRGNYLDFVTLGKREVTPECVTI